MDYVKLGRTGLDVSPICLGCMSYGDPQSGKHAWTLPDNEARPFIRKALDLGINFFDTANSYSAGTSEEIVGRALKDFARRDEIVLATKVFFGNADLGWIMSISIRSTASITQRLSKKHWRRCMMS
jgi:aryl-alcohol dehydrogenase-like predicted oxidoreductase